MNLTGKLEGLDPILVQNLGKLASMYGKPVNVYSGRRTTAEQQVLYDMYKAGTGNLAAVPGTSEHESGLSADADVNDFTDDQLAKAGLYRTAEGEAWHVSHIPRNKGGASMQPINMQDMFSGKNYNIPTDYNYPKVVPEDFYNQMAQKPIANSKAMAQRAMVDMLPILANMYKGATYNDSANNAAKVITDMISGGAAARGEEGNIQNQMTQRGNMAEILKLIGQSKNPQEMAGLVSAGKPFGGSEISPSIIGASTVSPAQMIHGNMQAATAQMGQSGDMAKMIQAKQLADDHNTIQRDNLKYQRELMTNNATITAKQELIKAQEKAQKTLYDIQMDIEKNGIDDKSKAALYDGSIPLMIESLKYAPHTASKRIYNGYVKYHGNDTGLNKELAKYNMKMDKEGNLIALSSTPKAETPVAPKPSTAPANNTKPQVPMQSLEAILKGLMGD